MEDDITAESQKSDRSLSPILNNNLYRKRLYEHKKSNKTRVQLAKRFIEDNENEGNESSAIGEFKKPLPPAKRFKSNYTGFCTGSGKNIPISSEAVRKRTEMYKDLLEMDFNENNPTVFKKDFSAAQGKMSSTVNTSCKQTKIDEVNDLNDAQIVLNAEAAAIDFSSANVPVQNTNENSTKSLYTYEVVENAPSFFAGECPFSVYLVTKVEKDDKEFVPSHKGGSETEPDVLSDTTNELDILNNTLCTAFAQEDLTLTASVNHQRNYSDATKKESINEEVGPSTSDNSTIITSDKHSQVPFEVNIDNNNTTTTDNSPKNEIKITSEECKPTLLFNKEDEMQGFVTDAAKQTIKIPYKIWKNSKSSNTSLDVVNNTIAPELMKENNKPISGFLTASGNDIRLSESGHRKAKNLFADEFNVPDVKFTTASGKNIQISDNAYKNGKNLLVDQLNDSLHEHSKCSSQITDSKEVFSNALASNSLDFADSKASIGINSAKWFESNQAVGFLTASGKNVPISEKVWTRSKHLFADEFPIDKSLYDNHTTEEIQQFCPNLKSDNLQVGFSTGSGKNIEISARAFNKTKELFSNEYVNEGKKLVHLDSISSTKLLAPSQVLEGTKKIFSNDVNINGQNIVEHEAIPEVLNKGNNKENVDHLSKKDENVLIETPEKKLSKSFKAKKRLGTSGCKQTQIQAQSLVKAEMIFKDDDLKKGFSTPVRSNIYCSTPLKENVSSTKQSLKQNLLTDSNITPVKRACKDIKDETSSLVMREKTEGDTDSWLKIAQNEYSILQRRLQINLVRQRALEEQKQLLGAKNNNTGKMQILGILSEKKRLNERFSLRNFLSKRKPGDLYEKQNLQNSIIWDITPKNAVTVHFNCSWNNEFIGVVVTTDGAKLIPNSDNLIGLSEIKAAFKAMLGVDPKLIPHGWIDNHFKWIVWKLASYERNFSNIISESLSIENIIQQLKYRYDREIDKAERPALRRILEKDDIPQKRMVLCVADIIKVGNLIEIELTDGWYSIRTTIDQLLKEQINLSKIVVGTKLVTQCAEILNCDGCHPLEVPEHVRLKINFNCTRRAARYAKLGYQPIAKPFPLSLQSICCAGGIVGCIAIQIIRVYPLGYMEKLENGKSVWRNNKAENKRIREWETQKAKEIDAIHQKVREQYEEELKNVPKMDRFSDLSDTQSSESLYRMMETSNDPDNFKEKLSASQLSGILNYRQNILNKTNDELSKRVSKELEKLKGSKREVYSIMKLLVVDQLKKSDETYVLNVWRPSEEHLHLLKEGLNFLVYNVVLKSNGDFSSTNKTYFKSEPTTPGNTKYQRKVLSILDLQKPVFGHKLKEFDTIGTVVYINKSDFFQEAWVTDGNGNLLLLKIFEGANKCCLLDNVCRGQTMAFMNLIFCNFKLGFAQGIANQFSVLTCFPQHKLLQDALMNYNAQLPKDKTFLDDCDTKIKKIQLIKAQEMSSSISSSKLSVLLDSESVLDDSLEDNTFISSRLTTTDVAMSLIDTDQYFEST